MTDPLTQWLDETEAKCRAATPGPWRVGERDRFVPQWYLAVGDTLIADSLTEPADAAYIAALPPETVQALLECVRAAALASDEIQSQHTMWPGEVDDLADALARLRALAGREG